MSYTFHFICDGDMQSHVGNTRGLERAIRRTVDVTSEQLKEQLGGFLEAIDSIINVPAFTEKNGFVMDEIELNLSVGAEGEISVLSSATGGISASSGIKIKLKRKQ